MWGLSVYQWLVFNQCVVKKKMEAIKKKMAALKEEKEAALEKKDEAEALRKEAEERADAVRQRSRPPTHCSITLATMVEYRSHALAPSIFGASSFGR